MSNRPKCIWCGKPLQKLIHSVYVPFNCIDVEAYIKKQIAGDFTIMDSEKKIREHLEARKQQFTNRTNSAAYARKRLRAAHNEPEPTTISDKLSRRREEEEAKDPDPEMYRVRVRVWRGKYGPDGRGLFHANTCAQSWAVAVAGQLRKEGKL